MLVELTSELQPFTQSSFQFDRLHYISKQNVSLTLHLQTNDRHGDSDSSVNPLVTSHERRHFI